MSHNPVEDSAARDQMEVIPIAELNDVRYIAYFDPRANLFAGNLMPRGVSLVSYDIGGEMSATCYGYGRVVFPQVLRSSATPPEPQLPIRVSDPRTRESLEAAVQRIQELQQLRPNWDSYGGLPIRREAIENALTILIAVLAKGVPLPAIVPTSSGGVQLEWHNVACDIELEVTETLTSVFFSLHGDHERTWEGTLASTGWHLDRFLSYVVV